VSLSSLPEAPACADCEFLLGKRTVPEYFMGWLCNHPENILSRVRNVVTGLTETKYVKMNCAEARSDETACGPAGKGFKLYVKPQYPEGSPSAGGKASADKLFAELEKL